MRGATYVAAHCYWAACATLRRPKLSPAEQATAMDTIHQLATHGTTRVRQIAARRLTPRDGSEPQPGELGHIGSHHDFDDTPGAA